MLPILLRLQARMKTSSGGEDGSCKPPRSPDSMRADDTKPLDEEEPHQARERPTPGANLRDVPGADEDEDIPALAVIVVAYGRPDLLSAALESVRGGQSESGWPIVVVDNSSDRAVESVTRLHGARYIDPGSNLGFSRAVNLGVRSLDDPRSDVLLLNPDATVDSATVAALHERLHMDRSVACVAPAQTSPDGDEQRVRWTLPTPVASWAEALGARRRAERGDPYMIGSILMIKRDALDSVGPFDEAFFLYGEEADWQRRALDDGWRVEFCADLRGGHVGAATSDSTPDLRLRLFASGHERYTRKWHGELGWQSARCAVVVGALLRAAVASGPERRTHWRRARVYAIGPSRALRRHRDQLT